MDGIEGIDFGDLPETLDEIARAAELDDDLPLRKQHGKPCAHRLAWLNHEQRELRCRNCDALLDPFDFLVKLANDADHWVKTRKKAERQAHEAKARLEDLLRQEKNARARIRRLERGG